MRQQLCVETGNQVHFPRQHVDCGGNHMDQAWPFHGAIKTFARVLELSLYFVWSGHDGRAVDITGRQIVQNIFVFGQILVELLARHLILQAPVGG